MMENGLVEEVERLEGDGLHQGSWCPCRAWATRRSWTTWTGKLTLEEAVYILKRDTRHFAKRQLTWFKRERDVTWLDRTAFL